MNMQQIQGIASKRTCTLLDHDQLEISHVCTYEQCEQNCRWACAKCILKKLHNHNFNDQKYLKDQKQFVAYLELKKPIIEQTNLKVSQIIQDITEKLKKMKIEIDNLIKFLQIGNNELYPISDVISKAQKSLFHLSNDELNQSIKLNQDPNDSYEYLQLEQVVQDCISKFAIYQKKNQPQSQDLYGQYYKKSKTNINNVQLDKEQHKVPPIIKKDFQEQGPQKKQIFQLKQSGQSTIQMNQQQMIAQPSYQAQGFQKSPLFSSRIKYEQPQNQMLNEITINSQNPQIKQWPTTNPQSQSCIRQFQPEDQIINDRQKQAIALPNARVLGQATPLAQYQTQQIPSFANDTNQNLPQSAGSVQAQQKSLAFCLSPHRIASLPNNFSQQNQISQNTPNHMGYQSFKK